MATNYAILRTAKLKHFGNIGGSLSHNYRTRDTPNADPNMTPLNQHSVSDSETVMTKIRELLPKNRRKDAVLCLEYLITASPNWRGWHDRKEAGDKYFEDAIEWLKQKHGAENVVATTIHLDEKTPHLVAYVVPIVNGKLNAKKFTGGRKCMSDMQTDFAEKVAKKYGLERGIEGSKAEHTTTKQYYSNINNSMPTGENAIIDYPTERQGGFLNKESDEDFALRVASAVIEGVKTQLDRVEALENELKHTKKRLDETRSQLDSVLKETKRYRVASNRVYVDKDKFDDELEQRADFIVATGAEAKRQAMEAQRLEKERAERAKMDLVRAERQRQAIERQTRDREAFLKRNGLPLDTDILDKKKLEQLLSGNENKFRNIQNTENITERTEKRFNEAEFDIGRVVAGWVSEEEQQTNEGQERRPVKVPAPNSPNRRKP